MLHRVESRRITQLSLAFLTMLISGAALADISIRYSGGNHGYGISIGHGIKYYGYGSSNYGYNRYYKPYKRKYHRRGYRNHYYNKYSRPYYYQKKRKYYRPRSYYYNSLGHSGSSTYSPASRYYSNKKYSNDPWDSLANGRSPKALYAFTKEVQYYPEAGIPKAGYAIAAASSGDLDKGVWAMRRAFDVDPESLHTLSGDTRLHHSINHLLPKYEYSLQHRGHHKDEAFMVAALNYLKGDYGAAQIAANRAAKDRDRSRSLKNLKNLLSHKTSMYDN